MKDETRTWLSYAEENLDVAGLSFDHGHLNACLQNAQQAVEKYLKAVIVDPGLEFRRTHSIRKPLGVLAAKSIALNVSAFGSHRYGGGAKGGGKPTYSFYCYEFDGFAEASHACWKVRKAYVELLRKRHRFVDFSIERFTSLAVSFHMTGSCGNS